MKKNRMILLTVLLTLLTVSFGTAAVPEASSKKKPPKLVIPIEIPEGITDENLGRQLDCFARVAALVRSNDRNSLSRSFSRPFRREISRWLLKAAEIEKDECHKNYLEALAGNIAKKHRFTTDIPRWNDLEENRAEIIFAEDERFRICRTVMESYFKVPPVEYNWEKHGYFDTFIYLNDPEETLKFREYSDVLAKMQDNLPPMAKQEMPYSPLRPVFKPVHLVFSTNPAVLTLVYPGITGPAGDGISSFRESGEGSPFKIIIFKNLVKAYLDGVLRTIAGRVLAPERTLDVDYESYMSNIVMHRISHHLGPVFVVRFEQEEVEYLEIGDKELDQQKIQRRVPKKKKKKKKEKELKTIPEILKDLFPIMESMKADMAALHNTEVLIESGLISEDKDINIYSTYLVSLVDRLRHLPDKKFISKSGRMKLDQVIKEDKIEDFLSALIQFNHLFNNEAIVFDINSKTLDIDRLKFKDAVEQLTKSVFRYIMRPVYENVDTYIDNKLIVHPQLEEILKKVEGIPLNVKFRSGEEARQ